MHQDLAGGKNYRKKGKVHSFLRWFVCVRILDRVQVEKVRKQFTADIRMVESRRAVVAALKQ